MNKFIFTGFISTDIKSEDVNLKNGGTMKKCVIEFESIIEVKKTAEDDIMFLGDFYTFVKPKPISELNAA